MWYLVKNVFISACLLICITISVLVSVYFYNITFIESNSANLVAPANTSFITIGKEEIAYSEIDNHATTTVIFVGGLSAWNGTWERTIQALQAKRIDLNYIALDLPPFGYSSPDMQKGFFRGTQAERIASFITTAHIENVILVGHSYGAGPVTEYVLGNQQHVKKLILIDAAVNIDEQKVVSPPGLLGINFLRNSIVGVLIHNDYFALSRMRSFVFIQNHINQTLLDTYTQFLNTQNTTKRVAAWILSYTQDPLTYSSNYLENYKTLSMPVELIWGDRDTLTPITGTKKLLDTIPKVHLTTLEGVGHIPMIENYELFDKALLDALSR